MKWSLVPLLAATLATHGTVHATDDAAHDASSSGGLPRGGWNFQITPYGWAAGIDGRVSPFERAPTIDFEKSFSEIMEDLNFAGFINVWGRRDRFVVSADVAYVDTTDSKSIGALPIIGPTPGLEADVDTRQFISTVQAGYRLIDDPSFSLDALAGARYWNVSNAVTVRFAGYSRTYDEDFHWVDPVVGARAFYRLTEALSLQGQADIGGFAPGGSRFTWQALGTVNFAFTDRLSASVGYKALRVDYDRDSHVFDTTLSGPVLGVTLRF